MSERPTDYSRFVQPKADEELHQSPPAAPVFVEDPKDGMPVQMPPQNMDIAPGLTEEALVCMGDTRSFVIRDDTTGEVVRSYPVAQQLPSGLYVVDVTDDESIELRQGRKVIVVGSDSYHVNVLSRGDKELLIVEPVRPPCVHYLRMQTDLATDRAHRYFARACMGQRSEDGEYLSLRDSMVLACTLRSPRHLPSEEQLERFDDMLKKEARLKQENNEFDVDAELRKDGHSDASGGGIFG